MPGNSVALDKKSCGQNGKITPINQSGEMGLQGEWVFTMVGVYVTFK